MFLINNNSVYPRIKVFTEGTVHGKTDYLIIIINSDRTPLLVDCRFFQTFIHRFDERPLMLFYADSSYFIYIASIYFFNSNAGHNYTSFATKYVLLPGSSRQLSCPP